jgi:hypothetical protein
MPDKLLSHPPRSKDLKKYRQLLKEDNGYVPLKLPPKLIKIAIRLLKSLI